MKKKIKLIWLICKEFFERWITQEKAPIIEINEKNITTIDQYKNATALGHMCKNPFEGIALNRKKGSDALLFTACFTCPNAILLLDAETLSRLLQVKKHYLDYECRIDPLRWEALYAQQLNIIDREILTRFDPELWEEAERLSKTLPPLPELR